MPGRSRLFVPWLVLATVCSVAMWLLPGEETIPYHLAWIGVAFAYGVEPWPFRRAVVAIAVYTVLTGGILVARVLTGVLAWGETAEIPMMSALMLLVVLNVRRRHDAFAELSSLAQRDRARAEQRERFSKMTSHEMRTPATIASGYAEMLLATETDPAKRADLAVIHDELERLVLVGDRLVRMIRMQDRDDVRLVDTDALLAETAERWGVLADRRWVVSAHAGRQLGSPERLRACLDTLLENAVRYTAPGDTVRLVGRVHGEHVLLGVADSGHGLDELLVHAVNEDTLGSDGSAAYVARDPKAKTGLGLALVREAALARGGRLLAGTSSEGGALLLLAVPRRHTASVSGPRAELPSAAELTALTAPAAGDQNATARSSRPEDLLGVPSAR